MSDKGMDALADFKAEQDKKQLSSRRAAKNLATAVKKRGANIDVAIAEALMQVECPSLYLEWATDRYWALAFQKLIPSLDRIYDKLVADNVTQDNKTWFNDADDTIFFLPDKHNKVFCHTGQNHRHIYIWEKEQSDLFNRFHIRRYYDRCVVDEKDKFDMEDLKAFQKAVAEKGYEPAIIKADGFAQEYADDYKSNPYPDRYSLQHYIDNKFEVKYGDFRDRGYVLTYEAFCGPKIDGAHYTFHHIKHVVECYIPCIVCELFEEDNE